MASIAVPAALASAVVGRGHRFLARLINAVPYLVWAITYAVLFAIVLADDGPQIPFDVFWSLYGLGLVVVAWAVANLVLLLTKSRTVASHLLGFEYRRITDAEPAGGLALAKILLTDLLVYVTGGIFGIVTLVTYRDGQSTVDRWLGAVAVFPHLVETASTEARSGPNMSWERKPEEPVRTSVAAAPNFGGAPVVPPPAAPPPVSAPPPHFSAPPAAEVTQVYPTPVPQPGMIVHTPFAPPQEVDSDELLVTQPEDSVEPTPSAAPMLIGPQLNALAEKTVLASAGPPRIRLDDGTELDVTEPVVFGRNPVTPQAHPDAKPYALIDESMRLSKTHVVVFAVDGAVQVYDVGARNGVLFEIAGQRSKISATQDVAVPAGAIVHFGGRALRVVR